MYVRTDVSRAKKVICEGTELYVTPAPINGGLWRIYFLRSETIYNGVKHLVRWEFKAERSSGKGTAPGSFNAMHWQQVDYVPAAALNEGNKFLLSITESGEIFTYVKSYNPIHTMPVKQEHIPTNKDKPKHQADTITTIAVIDTELKQLLKSYSENKLFNNVPKNMEIRKVLDKWLNQYRIND